MSLVRALSIVALIAANVGLTACGGADADSSAESDEADLAEHGPYPIVLLHGMAGFKALEHIPLDIGYFNGVKDDLALHGETEVFTTLASPYDSSEVRAAQIARQIDEILAKTGKKKVNLVGHSQGGLDARVLASRAGLGYGDRVASVTTISTPHDGTKLADLTLSLVDHLPGSLVDGVANALLDLLQISIYDVQTNPNIRAQVTQLSREYMRSVFNPKYVDDGRVRYASYGGRTNFQTGWLACGDSTYPNDGLQIDAAQVMFLPTAIYLQGPSGTANDGLVTVDSARWGEFLQCVPADHLKEVGLFDDQPNSLSGFDHLAFFRTVVGRLRDRGF